MPMRSLRRLKTKLPLIAVMCLLLTMMNPLSAEALSKRNIGNALFYEIKSYKPYNGKQQKWEGLFYWRDPKKGLIRLVAGKDYTVSGNKGTNAGTYVCKVRGIGKYTGTRKMIWKISPCLIHEHNGAFSLVNFTYNGKSHTTRLNSRPDLLGNKDYRLEGKLTATKRGTYHVWVVGRGNNWRGRAHLEWKIY